ncbi:MAG: Smr/MutS family protein [Xanthobacteraceae bacterium]
MTSRRRRQLTDDERRLWGGVTRSVAPLRRKLKEIDGNEAAGSASDGESAAVSPARLEHRAPIAPKPTLRVEPLERRVKQRLARGTIDLDARLDLHGKTQSEAHRLLLGFLRRAQEQGARFVLVITGKGVRTGDDWSERGVLRRQVPLWLGLAKFRHHVSGFEEADITHGGSGALYVRLRRLHRSAE